MRLPWQHALVGLLLPAETQRWSERDDRFAMMRYRLPHLWDLLLPTMKIVNFPLNTRAEPHVEEEGEGDKDTWAQCASCNIPGNKSHWGEYREVGRGFG